MEHVFTDGPCPEADIAETYRRELMQSSGLVSIRDLGAGSAGRGQERRMAEIARTSLQRPRYSRFLFRLCRFLQPHTVLELGTSFGITTQYLALGAGPQARVISLEGNPPSLAIARTGFERSGLQRIESVQGGFDEQLPEVLGKLDQIGLAFMDGNHRLEPTLRYFSWLEPLLRKNSVVVMDDIWWSAEMQQAWKELIRHPRVTLSVDMFQFGLLFFNTDLSSEHFILRY